MKKITITLAFIIGFAFAQEMEVDGVLRVTGGINAEGQPITNVGDPQNPSDAATMSSVETIVNNMPGLGGMTPERIYSYVHDGQTSSYTFTVPDSKFWYIEIFLQTYSNQNSMININGTNYWTANWNNGNGVQVNSSNPKLYLLPGNSIAASTTTTGYILTIFEYPISGSGTDQGMNYVEP